MTPYYDEDGITIYCGDWSDGLPEHADAIVTDPPYGETSLSWDRWPLAWPRGMVDIAPQLWCFGSMRMFLEHNFEFSDWSFAQEIVWEKHNGSSFDRTRFRRVHEFATHWYRGPWSGLTLNEQTTADATKHTVRRKARPAQWQDAIGDGPRYVSNDGGPRLMRSVVYVRSENGSALHPTQKPLGILAPLIAYSTNPGDTVFDPFMGSGSTLIAARLAGRKAVGCDAQERYCEIAVKRLAQGVLL